MEAVHCFVILYLGESFVAVVILAASFEMGPARLVENREGGEVLEPASGFWQDEEAGSCAHRQIPGKLICTYPESLQLSNLCKRPWYNARREAEEGGEGPLD